MPAHQTYETCPTPNKGALVGRSTNLHVIVQPPCNRWRCPRCSKIKAFKLQQRMALTRPNRFLTLTHHPRDGESPPEALVRMRRDWHIMQRRLQRANSHTPLRYLLVVEWTGAGFPHFHILLNSRFLPQRTISRAWKEIHGAPIVDIRRVRQPKRAAKYLSKYLTKATPLPPRMRRWSCSRGYLPPLPLYVPTDLPPDLTWTYSRIPPVTIALQLTAQGNPYLEGPRGSILVIDTT